ncbi:MAG: RNA methyltransferase [Bacteroidaceae bacterium]|nr:RNA methyltransferase [Bacteroidaceae bacterium]
MPRKLKTIEIERISVEEFHEAEKMPLVVVLDNVRSMYNIGSVFRTADAFRIEEVLLCGITATPPSNEIHKTALGAEESVAWQYFEKTTDAVAYLKGKGYTLCAIEQCEGSVMLNDFRKEEGKSYAVFMGNEVKGVQQTVIDECDVCIEIPQYGTKHSMNVSVTAGIVMWEMVSKKD